MITVKEYLRKNGRRWDPDIWNYISDGADIDVLEQLSADVRAAAEEQVRSLGLEPAVDLKKITFDVDHHYEGVEIDFKIERSETPKEREKRLAIDKAKELRKLAKEAEKTEKRRALYEELRKEFEQ